MFFYEKFLQRPIKIKNTNPRLANIIVTQYGGADGNCLSKSLLPKHTFDGFSIIATFDNFLENSPCHLVFFNIVYTFVFQNFC